MNWDALGAVGEIVGALAVVISLLYLAIQIRAGSRVLRIQMRDSAYHALQNWNYHVAADPELPLIFQKGGADYESLDERQKARFLHIMWSFFKMFENIYIHYLDGSVGEETWNHNKDFLSVYVQQPGCRYYWENRKASFDPRFRTMVESMEPPPIPPGHAMSGVAGEPSQES